MQHITFDLETIGRSSRAPIVQIAALAFDADGRERWSFDRRIALTNEDMKRFEPDISTIEWWMLQSEAARTCVFGAEGRVSFRQALTDFSYWVSCLLDKKKFWSHSTFDPPILCNAYETFDLDNPVHFRDFQDIRTLAFLAGEVEVTPRESFGAAHDAAADCRFQASYIATMLRKVQRV